MIVIYFVILLIFKQIAVSKSTCFFAVCLVLLKAARTCFQSLENGCSICSPSISYQVQGELCYASRHHQIHSQEKIQEDSGSGQTL